MGTTFNKSVKTPWHLWVVGFVSLLWNSVGGFSYTMTRLGMLERLGMGEEEIAYFASAPAWSNFFWALGVWGAILGSILILLRSRFAVHSFVAAIISSGEIGISRRIARADSYRRSMWIFSSKTVPP